jgi:FG-GAP repeat
VASLWSGFEAKAREHLAEPCMSTIHRVSVCASIVLAALASFPAGAELPQHPNVRRFLPTRSECLGFTVDDGRGCLDFGEPAAASSFGSAVAIRNGIAFVGNTDAWPTARVAVYGQTATGSWIRTGTLTAPDAASVDGFGRAIVFRDGLVLIASARAVHVFKRSNGVVWTAVQKLTPPPIDGPADFRQFPREGALKYENGILAIGSVSYSDSTFVNAASVVYIYERDATGKLVRRATLRPSDASPHDQFGTDVGVARNEVVVGAPGLNAAYVFRRRSDGRYVEAQKLQTADTPARGGFGSAVAIDRGMIIVGAPDFDCVERTSDYLVGCGDLSPHVHTEGGAAFGFVPIAGSYAEVFKLRPRPDELNERRGYWDFGNRIVMFDKLIAIAAGNVVYGEASERFEGMGGLVFTYTRDGSNVSARGLASGYLKNSKFSSAWRIALANNWLLVGSTENGGCIAEGIGEEGCVGEANLFDLNRFVQ